MAITHEDDIKYTLNIFLFVKVFILKIHIFLLN